MLIRHYEEDVSLSYNMTEPAQSDLGALWRTLARDLGFSTEHDSAAALSALLDHHKREESNFRNHITVLIDDNVSSSDIVCVVTLNTAAEWLGQSEERADALLQYESLMQRVNEWTEEYSGEREISPYVAGLQVLLRMCMNSERPAMVGSCQLNCLQRDDSKWACDLLRGVFTLRAWYVHAVGALRTDKLRQ
jgi:hypothetical protein